jgi:hypothetical protein
LRWPKVPLANAVIRPIDQFLDRSHDAPGFPSECIVVLPSQLFYGNRVLPPTSEHKQVRRPQGENSDDLGFAQLSKSRSAEPAAS